MKSNISKNARTDRQRAEKIKYNGVDVDPVYVMGHYCNQGSFMGVMYSETKKIAMHDDKTFVRWEEVTEAK